MYPGFYFDRTMILLLPAVIIAFWAQTKVSSTYKKYKSVRTINGYTGENIARMILDSAGLYDVPVVEVRGELTDHYDPVSRQIRLSTEVFHRASIASAGVAAHEVGHAIQHAQAYKPLVLRTSIAKAVNFSSQASIIIFMLGLLSYPHMFPSICWNAPQTLLRYMAASHSHTTNSILVHTH